MHPASRSLARLLRRALNAGRSRRRRDTHDRELVARAELGSQLLAGQAAVDHLLAPPPSDARLAAARSRVAVRAHCDRELSCPAAFHHDDCSKVELRRRMSEQVDQLHAEAEAVSEGGRRAIVPTGLSTPGAAFRAVELASERIATGGEPVERRRGCGMREGCTAERHWPACPAESETVYRLADNLVIDRADLEHRPDAADVELERLRRRLTGRCVECGHVPGSTCRCVDEEPSS